MYIVVMLNGGQGFLPDCCKNDRVSAEAFAQDILDRYGSTDYLDDEILEYRRVESWYWRFRHWLRAFPLYRNKG